MPSQQKKSQKGRESIIEIFHIMKKSKKEIMLTIETKICQVSIEARKEYMANYYYKRKTLLTKEMFSCAGELGNVCISKKCLH